MNKKNRQLWFALIALTISVLGVFFAAHNSVGLNSQVEVGETTEKKPQGFEVAVEVRHRELFDQVIASHAQVLPHQTSRLNPMVFGRVVEIKAGFEAGRRVSKGQVLAELDKTDFRYNLAKARQTLAGAELKLQEQQALSERAIAEWKTQRNTVPSGLAARTPQVHAAQAEVDAAAMLVAQAARDLAAASVVAPFDGWIVKRNTSVGNVVDFSTSLAELIAADKVIVRIPLTSAQIHTISFSDDNTPVAVELSPADKNLTQRKLFNGLALGSIVEDKTGQVFAEGIVAVKESEANWLRPGAFLSAKIYTRQQGEYFAVPQAAVNAQGNIFILADGVAKEIDVETIFVRDESLIVDIPDTNQIRLISSGIQQVWNGMPAYARNKNHE